MDQAGVVQTFLECQNAGDIDCCLELIAEDAVFDVGRGRYEGKEQIRSFVTMLVGRGSHTTVVESRPEQDGVRGLWEQVDDDGRRLGIPQVQLQAQVRVRDGKILSLHARPTAESLAALRAAAQGQQDLTPEALRALRH